MTAFGKPHLYKPEAPWRLRPAQKKIVGMIVTPLRVSSRSGRLFCPFHKRYCTFVDLDRKTAESKTLLAHPEHLIPLQDFPPEELRDEAEKAKPKEAVR